MGRIIYSKTYPKNNYDDLPDTKDMPDIPPVSFEEFMENMNKHLRFEEIPGRREKVPRFIDETKALCDDYEYDVVIEEAADGILAFLSLDVGQYTDCRLNRRIGMADDIGIVTGIRNRDVTLYLRYNVLAVYRGDTRIFPELLDE